MAWLFPFGAATFPVGSFPSRASWCGALDMAGNAWEWCSDWYDKTYYANSPEADPAGPGTGTSRLLRGGSWSDYGVVNDCRSAYRIGDGYGPFNTCTSYGFRCVRTP